MRLTRQWLETSVPNKPIRLLPNEPQTVKLVDPRGDSENYDFGLQLGRYQTTDGRTLVLPRPAVERLNELDPEPGEAITICRYAKERGRKYGEWTVALSPSSEKARAIREQEAQDAPPIQSDEELLLEASLKRQDASNAQKPGKVAPIRKPSRRAVDPEIQPRLFDRGTGTHGPAPAFQRRADAAPLPAIAVKTPYPEMLRHIVRTVENVLKLEGLQLGDGPKQDLISTVYIDAAKRCGVEYDFTTEAKPE
jgi:hypothetical protein